MLAQGLAHAAAVGFASITVVVALERTIAMVHGSTVDAASERVLPGRARPGLTTGRPVLAGSMTMLSRLLWWLCRPVRDGSTAAAPPSASLPSGISGRRIRSLIHASLLFGLRVAGSHIYEPPFRAVAYSSFAGVAAVGYFAEIESVTSVWRSEIGREERLHGK